MTFFATVSEDLVLRFRVFKSLTVKSFKVWILKKSSETDVRVSYIAAMYTVFRKKHSHFRSYLHV